MTRWWSCRRVAEFWWETADDLMMIHATNGNRAQRLIISLNVFHQLNGRRVRTPISINVAGAKVITSGTYSLLDTSFGLQVKFDGVHHLEITVPGEYFDKVRRS